MEKSKVIKGELEVSALGFIASLLGINVSDEKIVVYKYDQPTDDGLHPGHVAVKLQPEDKTFFSVPPRSVNWN